MDAVEKKLWCQRMLKSMDDRKLDRRLVEPVTVLIQQINIKEETGESWFVLMDMLNTVMPKKNEPPWSYYVSQTIKLFEKKEITRFKSELAVLSDLFKKCDEVIGNKEWRRVLTKIQHKHTGLMVLGANDYYAKEVNRWIEGETNGFRDEVDPRDCVEFILGSDMKFVERWFSDVHQDVWQSSSTSRKIAEVLTRSIAFPDLIPLGGSLIDFLKFKGANFNSITSNLCESTYLTSDNLTNSNKKELGKVLDALVALVTDDYIMSDRALEHAKNNKHDRKEFGLLFQEHAKERKEMLLLKNKAIGSIGQITPKKRNAL